MSYFDEMIATERITDSYVGWEQYRREVTEYIENNCRVKKRIRAGCRCSEFKACACTVGNRAGRRYRYRKIGR